MKAPVIQVEHLRKTYGPVVAVDDISFAIQAGEIFGLGDYQFIKGVAKEHLFSRSNRMETNEIQ